MNLSICKAKSSDVVFLKSLWLKAFNENFNEDYLDFVFEKLANFKYAHIIKVGEKPVGMGFILPAKLDEEKVFYLYSLAVEPDFRGKGLMTEFLKYSKSFANENNVLKLFLVPQNDELREYYKRRGYEDYSYFIRNDFIRNVEKICFEISEISTTEYVEKRNDYYQMHNISKLCINDEISSINEGAFFNQKIISFPYGYAVVSCSDDMLFVREILVDFEHCDDVIQGLMYNFSVRKASVLTPVSLNKNNSNKDKIPYAMICNLDGDSVYNNVYSNFMLD